MKEKFRFVVTHPLFSGSAIMMFGINAIGGLNYLYHFAMGRFLGAAAYGELATLFSLIGLLGMLPMALNLAITKFVSSATNKSEIHSLIIFLQKKLIYVSLLIVFFSALLSPYAKQFLKLSSEINFIFVGIILSLSLSSFVNRAVLQGLLNFKLYVLSMFVDTGLKLILGIGFVYIGWSIFGAMFALVLGSIIGVALTFYLIRDYLYGNQAQPVKLRAFFRYSLPVLVHQLVITSFISSDLILVKHFFNPIDAGNYSATSTIAKIIFFAASPIVSVMFPIISKRISNGLPYQKVFLLSILLTLFVTISGALFFTLFAPLAVGMLFGHGFSSAYEYLPLFSLFIILLSINNLFIGFFLSINKTTIIFFSLIIALLQILFIFIFHSTLIQVLLVSVITSALLTTGLIVYSIYEREDCFSNRTRIQATKNNRKRSAKNS